MRIGPSRPEEELPTIGEFLTVKEAAAYLKATPNTITIWCRAGQLPAIKIGRQWRISRKELDRMVTRRFGGGKPRPSANFAQEGQDE
ncbi:MAG: helix-turn-helix domain-containing protein [Chloroflexota bacterium]